MSNSKPTTAITPRPSTTSRARLARQNSVSDGFDQGEADDAMCEPYTITQGISSWAMHLKDPNPGYWTLDANCKWQGALSAADVTCTLSQSGSFASTFGDYTVTSDVIVHSSLEQGGFFSAVTVVKGSDVVQSSQASAAISKTGSPTSKPAATTGASAGSASASQSTGMAPLPTAAVVLLGGAAGVLAAALAL